MNMSIRIKAAHPANASTLKSRLTWNSGVVNGYKGLVEVDNVSVIGAERYNSTVNGLTFLSYRGGSRSHNRQSNRVKEL